MSALQQAFESGQFGVTSEIIPPKGCDFTAQLEAAALLRGKVHAVVIRIRSRECKSLRKIHVYYFGGVRRYRGYFTEIFK